MGYITKHLTIDQLDEAIQVERETIPTLMYLKQAYPAFENSKGALVGVYENDKLLGIGRITIFPDNHGWLETLRVKPSSQNNGVGKAIYNEWMKIAKENNVKSLSMYTGLSNERSSHLAELYGLETDQHYHGFHLTDLTGGNTGNFKHVSDVDKAVEEILKSNNQYHNRICMNRTFYKLTEEIIRMFVMEGKVFVDEESNSYVIIGARFQHEKAMHLALINGDYDKCIDFSISYTKANGNDKLSCTFALENQKLQSALENRGFKFDDIELITKCVDLTK